MAELRPLRAFSIEKVRNLLASAKVALKDARAPAEHISAPRRFDAAYDCGLDCALLVLECSKLELKGQGHHTESFDFLVKALKLRGQTAAAIPTMIKARNANRYDGTPFINEGVVASAIEWADRILAETEAWLAISQPLALK
jgi:hypothetical protein